MCSGLEGREILRTKLIFCTESGQWLKQRKHVIDGCVSAHSAIGRVHTTIEGSAPSRERQYRGARLGQEVKEGFCLLWNILIFK